MPLETFLKGCLIGILVSIPLGPIGLLCIRNSATYGALFGLIAGLGAACADTIYGGIATLGSEAVTHYCTTYHTHLKIIGSIVIALIGIRFIFSTPKLSEKSTTTNRLWLFVTTFLLTLTNPATLFLFIAIYALLGIEEIHWHGYGALQMILGVFSGAILWWCILSSTSARFRHKLADPARVARFNYWIGGLMFLSGIIGIIWFGLMP